MIQVLQYPDGAIPVELRTVMGDAKFWAENKTYPPSEAAVRLHHRLVKSYPFPNGNERHARIMAGAVLDRVYGAKPINWTGGHDLQKMGERRAAYIVALKAADGGDIDPLMKFIGKSA